MKKLNFKKNSKLKFYVSNALRSAIPRVFHMKKKQRMMRRIDQDKLNYLNSRVNYYLKHDKPFVLSDDSVAIKDYKLKGNSAYYMDLRSILNYFPLQLKVYYLFGDRTTVETTATIVKSRPIVGDNKNSVLMKLNSVRHFNFINDTIDFSDKLDMAVWRGKVIENFQPHRVQFLKDTYNNKYCDIGKTNKTGESPQWEKDVLSIKEQLKYKFLLCVEGNDVATNLKWAMSSNSLCMMCKPKYETWFMEGSLIANVHYVELKEDYSDLTEKIEYYKKHQDEAKKIVINANQYVEQFKNIEQELLISLLVMDKYFKLSGQM